MGQEQSQEGVDPNGKPYTLSDRSLDAVAEFIKDGPKKVVVMTGAGISTSAGIPDFRSPDTGLYSNLARLNLPHPEAVFELDFFREKPEPFYVLAKELYPGKFFPTVSHAFIALLHEKGYLHMLFTQNIDCLERRAGVPGDKIIEAHGSFATQRCIDCKTEYPDDLMKVAVTSGDVPHCIVPQCNGLVKPDIVFFGEQLPEVFHRNYDVPREADLVFVMGTSLSVAPFSGLPSLAPLKTPRVLFNKERVGNLGTQPDDVVVLGDCDAGVRKLADALGWRNELEALWHKIGGNVSDKEVIGLQEERQAIPSDESLEAELAKITAEVENSLKISGDESVKANNEHPDSVKGKENTSPKTQGADNTSGLTEQIPIPAAEVIPVNTEKVSSEAPAQTPTINTEAILDVTLPQNKPISNKEESDAS